MTVDQAVGQLADAIRATLEACDPPQEVARNVYAGPNLSECLSEALARVAIEQGGTEALVRHRPGCWEATHVLALAAGLFDLMSEEGDQ